MTSACGGNISILTTMRWSLDGWQSSRPEKERAHRPQRRPVPAAEEAASLHRARRRHHVASDGHAAVAVAAAVSSSSATDAPAEVVIRRQELLLKLHLRLLLRWRRHQRAGNGDGNSPPHQLGEEAGRIERIVEPTVEAAAPLQTRLPDRLLKVAPPSTERGLEGDAKVDPSQVTTARRFLAAPAAASHASCMASAVARSTPPSTCSCWIPVSSEQNAVRRGWWRGFT